MTTTCPLTVDWLDLLEGRPSVAARTHLDGCTSCQAVVTALTELPHRPSMQQNPRNRPAHTHVSLDDVNDPVIVEGQLRWLAVDDAEVRLPVLVLGLVDEDTHADSSEPDTGAATAGSPEPHLVDIVPMWTDLENATSSDLLL